MMTIERVWTFEAAHHLVGLSPGHKCAEVHGHSYTVRAEVTGEVGPLGWVLDYAEMDAAWASLYRRLDHQNLNLVIEQPTAENLARWIFERLALPGLAAVSVSETGRSSATWRPGSGSVVALSAKEAAVALGIHVSTLKAWRARGAGPKWVRFEPSGDAARRGKRRPTAKDDEEAGKVRYLVDDIRAWLMARRSAGTC